jgi:hypothetical protein
MWFEAPPLPQLKRLWSDYFSKHALLVRHNLRRNLGLLDFEISEQVAK